MKVQFARIKETLDIDEFVYSTHMKCIFYSVRLTYVHTHRVMNDDIWQSEAQRSG